MQRAVVRVVREVGAEELQGLVVAILSLERLRKDRQKPCGIGQLADPSEDLARLPCLALGRRFVTGHPLVGSRREPFECPMEGHVQLVNESPALGQLHPCLIEAAVARAHGRE